jgi:tRNA-2-methylthio-N6-dimethylallyladenosine synthase
MERARVHITTYGCQMNQLDAELVAEVLRASGAAIVQDPAEADVLLFVTCSVRAHAENRVFSNIGKLRDRKRLQPGLVIGLLGCMAQEHGPALRQRAPLVDVVCAPGRLAELPELIAEAKAGCRVEALDPERVPLAACPPVPAGKKHTGGQAASGTPMSEAAGDAALDKVELSRPMGPSAAGQAYVVAMRGCDNFCSYCVVPFVRGPERSRPPGAILREVRRLVEQGARQVTLLGQAVNKYRAVSCGTAAPGCAEDAHPRAGVPQSWDLADLLAAAAETPGLLRLSFITNHPRSMDEKLAAVFRDVPAVTPYLHMPAQSGSDAVLQRMNRGYTRQEYLDRVALVRSARPDVAVASDFIVGFPGESEADFEETLDLVRRARFSASFVFKYSLRPGTAAAKRLEDDVPDADKRRRHAALLALVEEIAGEENEKFVGRVVRVFVEEVSPMGRQNPKSEIRNPKLVQLRGRSPCNRIVVFDGPELLIGSEVEVEITASSPLTLFGKTPAPRA